MVIELPFELDTIDAISEAETLSEKCIAYMSRIGPFFLHILCAVMEFVAYHILNRKLEENIVCFKYFEISDPGNVFLILDYFCLLPDLVFAILGPLSIFMIYNNPFSVFFNGSAGLINIVNGVLYHVLASPCGNPESDGAWAAPILSYICGVLHVGLAVIAHLSFKYWDKEGELYFGRIQDVINEKN